jgi:hypothetical protein
VTQVAAVESVMGRDVKVAETMHQLAECAFGSVHLEVVLSGMSIDVEIILTS